MSGNTQTNAQAYHDRVQGHRDHASDLGRNQQNIDDTVQTLSRSSYGATMDKFIKVEQEWSGDVTQVKNAINNLAEWLETATNKLLQQDNG
jgi:hypothetical protein